MPKFFGASSPRPESICFDLVLLGTRLRTVAWGLRAVLGEQRDRIMSLRCEFAKLCDPAAWYLRLVEESGRDAVYDAKLQAL